MTAPRVTIGVPVFNGERYLAETLDSLLAQDFESFEVVVSNNASTDRTVELVRGYVAADARVRLVSNAQNRGAAYNYNRLVREARGELFKWAGYDDLLAPSYLSRCVAALDREPGAVLAFPGTAIVDHAGQHVLDYEDRLDLRDERAWRRVARYARRVNMCNACFGVMDREAMLETGLIRPYVSSDIVFLAEMAARGKFLQLPERLFYRRVHAGSSRQGRTNLAAVARWFDPSMTRKPRAPRLRLLIGCVAALAIAPLPLGQRGLAVAAYVVVYAVRRIRIRLGRVRAALTGRKLGGPELIYRIEGQP